MQVAAKPWKKSHAFKTVPPDAPSSQQVAPPASHYFAHAPPSPVLESLGHNPDQLEDPAVALADLLHLSKLPSAKTQTNSHQVKGVAGSMWWPGCWFLLSC